MQVVKISQLGMVLTANNMEYTTFEDYLKEVHDKQYHGTADDAPDDYENWLSNVDQEDMIAYADLYAHKYAFQEMIESIGYKPTK